MKFVGKPFCVSKDFWYRKVSSKGGWKIHGSVENFFYLTGPKKPRQGTILCLRKFLVGKNILWIRGVVSRFSVSVYRNISLENTLVFQKKYLSKKFMHRRGGATRFCGNFLSHKTERKSFVKQTFCFPEVFWYRKKFMDERGLVTFFSRNFYVSQCYRKLS